MARLRTKQMENTSAANYGQECTTCFFSSHCNVIYFIISDPTAMPRDIRATLLHGIYPVRILVSWTPVNVTKLNLKCDPRTTDYTYGVYYEDAENVSGYNISTLSSSTNVTIADGTLSQCTEYLISVGIKNAVGRVNMNSPVTVRTDSG
ncbi:hypothetical protein BSL78_25792, partial [Apostichopus japonicus]